ncbi:MAG: hypothetical protein AAF735_08455, partial [Myxococcota bacterium]
EGNTIGLRYESPGTCDVETGCVYEEERIPIADPINCDAIINDDCEILECPQTECGVDPEPALNPETGICECFYASGAEEGTACSDNNLCTGSASCDDAGRCRPDADARVSNFEACLDSNLAPVQALDDEGNARTLASGETAPEPYCMNGRCVECQRDTAEQDCNDGNPCTEDTCGFDGLCEHGPTRESESCTIDEPALHGPSGLCKQGECVECDADAANPNSTCTGSPPCVPSGTCELSGGRVNQCNYTPATAEGDACILGDGSNGVCSENGSCAGCINDIQCDDGNPCTLNGCNETSGECETSDVANGLSCTQGSGGDGVCSAGTCVECLADSQCDDGNPCTISTCQLTTNTCTPNENLPDGTRAPVCDVGCGDSACFSGICSRQCCDGVVPCPDGQVCSAQSFGNCVGGG